MPKRIQAVITTNGGVTKCKMIRPIWAVWVQTGLEYNSGKNVSSIEKIGHTIESMQSVNFGQNI